MKTSLVSIALAFAVFNSLPARGDIVVSITEVGGDVQVAGSGSIDLTGLMFAVTGSAGAAITPDQFFSVGPSISSSTGFFTGVFVGPPTIGTGTDVAFATSGAGDLFGLIFEAGGAIVVPTGYVSGDPLAGTSTYSGQTLGSLGLAAGDYSWTIGDNTVELSIVASSVPEPSSFLLFTFACAGLTVFQRRYNRAA